MANTPKVETKVKWFASPPAKVKCSCKSTFQDARYGAGIRLHNMFKNGKRCTICGNEKL